VWALLFISTSKKKGGFFAFSGIGLGFWFSVLALVFCAPIFFILLQFACPPVAATTKIGFQFAFSASLKPRQFTEWVK